MRFGKDRARAVNAVELPELTTAELSAKPKADRKLDDWRGGTRGRPTQLFVGFLPTNSKSDAVSYAIGVAERNAVNLSNAAYRVCPWQSGWAYEVHEGGPKRAYLPAVLRFFDEHAANARLDDLVAHVKTTGRAVRIEKTQTGLVALVMPEDFDAPQSDWLEPGPHLSPALPSRLSILVVGLGLFLSGTLTLFIALNSRTEQPVEVARTATRFEELPISQWPAVLAAGSAGYVDALEYVDGQWKIRRAQVSEAGKAP